MNVQYIVNFNRSQPIMFDLELTIGVEDYDAMLLQIQMLAYTCITKNGFDADDVWKISTSADWVNPWCEEHEPMPSDFNGIFHYEEGKTLGILYSPLFNKELFDKMPLTAKAYTVAEYHQKRA